MVGIMTNNLLIIGYGARSLPWSNMPGVSPLIVSYAQGPRAWLCMI
jgi:hypothetical protein